MTEKKDWKRLYEELLQQQENQTAAEEELNQLLIRTIIRLTLAASGLDTQLDPHLKSIREAVRKGVSLSLKQKLDTLSDSLMHFSEDSAAAVPNTDALCEQLVTRFQISQEDSAEAARLFGEFLIQPEQMQNEDLSHLIGLLNKTPGGSERKKTGLLGRLLGSKSDTSDETDQIAPNLTLMNLLEQASWPGHWATDISQLKDRLSPRAQEDAWVSVLQDLLDLSARSFGQAKAEVKEAEDFLGELTRRLQDIEEHLRKASAGRSTVVKHSRKLNEEMSAQVGGLGSSIESATDLSQLKQDVSQRLQAIQKTMDTFFDEEERWSQETDTNEQELRERLQKLEEESNELRNRMLEAHHLALLDAVTELPNRMAYDERVEQEYARWKRFDEPLSMLVWDVDNFKSINDRFGHQAGDKVLRTVAQSLQKRLRETDFIARYGGEEFVALLCGAEGKEALKVAEQMRMSVQESGFHSGGKAVKITISCGLAQFTEGDNIESVFARADKALYQAKQNGKNRCEVV